VLTRLRDERPFSGQNALASAKSLLVQGGRAQVPVDASRTKDAKSFETVFELQGNFVKSSYENFIAEATKLGEMYADLAKNAYKPYETPMAAAAAKVSKASPVTPAAA